MKIIYDSDFDEKKDGKKSFNEKLNISEEAVFLNSKKTEEKPKTQKAEKAPEKAEQAQTFQGQDGLPKGAVPIEVSPEYYNYLASQFAAVQQMMSAEQKPPEGYVSNPAFVPGGAQPRFIPQPFESPKGRDIGTKVLFQSDDFEKSDDTKVADFSSYAPMYKEEYSSEKTSTSQPQVKKRTPAFEMEEIKMGSSSYTSQPKKRTSIKSEDVEHNEKKPEKKKISLSEKIRRAVLSISLLAILISGGMLLNEWRLAKQNNDLDEEISNLIIDDEPSKNDPQKQETTEKKLTPEEEFEKIKRENPNLIFPVDMQIKYAKLYATNQEFVGYLSAKGSNLSLPVVQTKDDSKYLKKNFYLQNTKYGCPFVTYLNNIRVLDQNTVIFGHHMNNKTIFGALDQYKTLDGYKKAPLIEFNTLYKDYSWKIIAAFITNAYAKEDNGYTFKYYFTNLSSQSNFSSYLSELSQRSLYDTGVDVLPTDKLLTLSTCSHEFNEARFVVVARLVRPGESKDVNLSKATVNSSVRYPQAWYDKKNKSNPYKNSFQWEAADY